jgi:Sortase domain
MRIGVPGQARPGDPGSAVILGHVDSNHGLAVLHRLRELHRGDEVRVRRADGSMVRFLVQRTEQTLTRRFPTDAVSYPTLTAGLRLVTCGGLFDRSTGPTAPTSSSSPLSGPDRAAGQGVRSVQRSTTCR